MIYDLFEAPRECSACSTRLAVSAGSEYCPEPLCARFRLFLVAEAIR